MQISHTLTELTFCVVYLLIIVKFCVHMPSGAWDRQGPAVGIP